jgi:hypothetical protein
MNGKYTNETAISSETSGATQRTTRRHVPEDDNLQTSWLPLFTLGQEN